MTPEEQAAAPLVLIVDDHDLFAQALTFALQAEGLRAKRCQERSAEGIQRDVEAMRPGLVLLDLDIGGELGTSLPLVAPLTERGRTVVMLTGVTDPVRLAECIRQGAVGIVGKAEPFDELVAAVTRALREGTLLSPAEREEHLALLRDHEASDRRRLERFERLTPRESQVLAALMDGRSAERIADDWVVSITTVRSQIRSVLQKLEVNSQLAAVALARRAGWRADPP